MGSAIASPSTTPVAFVGRPHGPPRCKSAPLYHRAQVTRPISQGLQGDETPFCARLRPLAPACARLRLVVPSSAVPHHPAPSRTVAPGPFRGAAPSHSKPLRTPAPSHPSAIAPRPLHTPVPSRSSAIAPRPFALLHRHTPALRVTSSIVATAFPDGISLESPLSYSLTVFAEIAGNRPPANLSQPDASFFRVVRV